MTVLRVGEYTENLEFSLIAGGGVSWHNSLENVCQDLINLEVHIS